MTRLVLLALVGASFALAPIGHSAPRGKPAACHRTKYRLIHGERVPWEHDVDDHEWEEFEHSKDECEPPPC